MPSAPSTPSTYTKHSEDTSVQRAGESMVDDSGARKMTADGRKNGLAGIGDVCGGELADAGFTQTMHILGQFLLLDMIEGLFTEWLNDATNGKCTSVNRERCYAGMWLYCRNNIREGMLEDSAGNSIETADGKSNGLAGVGDVSGAKLAAAEFKHTYNVLGQFLSKEVNQDEALFKDWLGQITDGKCNAGNRGKCFSGLVRFSRNNL